MTLALNLGLDSLDMAELVVFLQDQYDVSGVLVPDLTTVNKLMAYAAKKIVPNEVSAEPLKISKKWEIKGSRKRSFIAPGKTMPEVFLNNCKRYSHLPACGDDRSGVLTFADMKMRVILLQNIFVICQGNILEFCFRLRPRRSCLS